MVGTSVDTMGGISTVVRGYIGANLFAAAPVVYISTHSDGSRWHKLAMAARGYCRFMTLLAGRNVAVVHVHLSSRASFWRKLPIFVAAWLARKPVLLHLHGSEFMTFFEKECGPVGRRVVTAVFDRAEKLIVLSPQWAENVQRITANSNVEIIFNGVPVPEQMPASRKAEQRTTLLFLGRLGWRKGIYDMLEALAELARTGTEFHLIAAGDGEIEKVKRKVAELGLEQNVDVPGWIEDTGKTVLLKQADVFVLPSHAEGLPMSLLEAMAAGLPVVCTSVGGMPTAVSHEVEGLVVPPGDVPALARALERVLTDPDLRRRLGENAHARAKRDFDVRVSVQRLIEIYGAYL